MQEDVFWNRVHSVREATLGRIFKQVRDDKESDGFAAKEEDECPANGLRQFRR